MRYASFILIFLGINFYSQGQASNGNTSRNDYYIFPIKPGERNSLSGTMGELRSSHFHAGIDIRTEGRTGLPVHAAASGYISRISVSRGGYGNALYIQHPNGHTTVYAHLQEFKGAVAEYVKQMQYEQQSFELTLYFKAGEFPVKQGEVVALSGNSGSSGGPHVHFDLRDRNQDLLNPLSFGFDEIPDHTPPVAEKIALKTLTKESRVNGTFGRFEYAVKRVGNDYVIDQPISVHGVIGMELYAHDRLDNTRFRCGINLLEVSINDSPTYSHDISTFSFNEQRNILKHMDYEQVRNDGERFHKLYVDDGNYLRFYTVDDHKGRIHAYQSGTLPVFIRMTDSYGNSSTLSFKLEVKEPSENVAGSVNSDKLSWQLQENTLRISAPVASNKEFQLDGTVLKPDYVTGNIEAVYLHDMRAGLPQLAIYGTDSISFGFDQMIPHRLAQSYERRELKLAFPAEALFDTLYLQTDYAQDAAMNREYFTAGSGEIPLRKNVTLTLRPQLEYSHREKYAAYILDAGNNAYYQGGSWKGDEFVFTTRELGRFTLLPDDRPPSVSAVTLSADKLRFRIDDDLSGIDSFNCYVNGKWVLMYYDYKQKLLWSEKKSESDKFTGDVKLVVTDNVNNVKEFTTKIN
ncbi:M23 family metallopeptidase [Fulvivirga sedimenti]|uniref:M23 family metallopeptidase n=1 Tax=Fulvivirga sedimenti TaxID=2879465 RepID=A0A9X1HNS5_9BACT|nr:M23 family metallopeptidase [Fulvivirga sedimenti]MCA6073372.1 M23 family metallopeptidase [Fulvivirga sedimenti]